DIAQIERATRKLEDIFERCQSDDDIQEHLYIKTCNRSEIYLVAGKLQEDLLSGGDFIVDQDEEALRHLLRLASGLESMILGEDQILGQIKDARKKSIRECSIGPVLRTVFTKAIHVGQLARNNTRINQGTISIGSAAVELAESVHGDLKCKKVLIIGAGKMGTLVAKALVEKKLKAIVVANRTYGSAVKLAGELKGYAIHFDKLHEAMADADVVISATGAPHQILTYDQVKESVLPENRGSLVMVDLANPRDIDEKVKDLGVKLFNIDDLRDIADNSVKMRQLEVSNVEKIVEDELKLLLKSLKHLEVEPLISNIRICAEEVRLAETRKAFKMLGDLNGKEKIVDDLTQVVIDRIFFDVIKNLRKAAEQDDDDTIRAAEKIFSGE
ncbi:MAG TPA: glutamyl-tRNA reductase, partial [Methanobacteriaceae archaeon]|nr:glutamyl-tRNA reductase [Methanobacteriaceae archaeon]